MEQANEVYSFIVDVCSYFSTSWTFWTRCWMLLVRWSTWCSTSFKTASSCFWHSASFCLVRWSSDDSSRILLSLSSYMKRVQRHSQAFTYAFQRILASTIKHERHDRKQHVVCFLSWKATIWQQQSKVTRFLSFAVLVFSRQFHIRQRFNARKWKQLTQKKSNWVLNICIDFT